MKCKICGKEFSNYKGLGSHISLKHKVRAVDYYDTFLKTSLKEGKCRFCGKPTEFVSIRLGYKQICYKCVGKAVSEAKLNYSSERKEEISRKRRETNLKKYGVECPANANNQEKTRKTKELKYGNPSFTNSEKMVATKQEKYGTLAVNTWEARRENIEQFEKENNCTRVTPLIDKYGQGWLSLNIPRIEHKQCSFIENKYLKEIEKYATESHYGGASKQEERLKEEIEKIGLKTICGSYTIIAPYQLDIYIPENKIAIEFNGNYWHSTNKNTPKNYHLKKSLMCREKRIRLIHIYEFEDFEEQIELLISLLNGVDKYNNKNFNKNNLIKEIPKPKKIYEDKYNIIYGAGENFK